MKIVLLNAYSRGNSGDGLLVDESARLVAEAFPGSKLELVAMDPASFPEHGLALHPLAGTRNSYRPMDLLRVTATRRAHSQVQQAIARADLAVAVGGGYLRAPTFSAGLKSVLSHVCQAPSRAAETPYVYLPQSIGPLPPRWTGAGFGRLRYAEQVHVRDDRSLAELRHHGIQSIRTPDLAVLAVARDWEQSRPRRQTVSGRGPVGIVARALIGGRGPYTERVRELVESLDAELLIQSSTGRGNNDIAFYASLGCRAANRHLKDALFSEAPPSVTLSVRMHGSLESILAGVPSVHLSYERKGWGAYSDLGISPYVHNARDFDVARVIDQVVELREDPTDYWRRIENSVPRLIDERARLVSNLRQAVERS